MGMADINKSRRKQGRMSELDRTIQEYECLEYYLTHEPEKYGNDLKLAKARYNELKKYFEENPYRTSLEQIVKS